MSGELGSLEQIEDLSAPSPGPAGGTVSVESRRCYRGDVGTSDPRPPRFSEDGLYNVRSDTGEFDSTRDGKLVFWFETSAKGQVVPALLHWARGRRIRNTRAMRSRPHPGFRPAPRSAFAGYRFSPEVITLAVRWYLRFGLSYRDVEELLAERGIEVDHVTVYRWVSPAGTSSGIAGTSTRRT